MKKINILLFSPLPPPVGGIASWTKRYLEYCGGKGINATLINTSVIGKRKLFFSKRNIFEEIKRFCLLKKQVDLVDLSDIDVVHFNTNCSKLGLIRDYFLIKRLLKRRFNLPIILHCRCNIEDYLTTKLSIRFFKKIIDSINTVFVLNKSSFRFVSRFSSKIKVYIVPNFVEDNLICCKHNILKTIKNVIFFGHIKKSKGANEIVLLAEKYPSIIFNLAGPVFENYEKIIAQFPNIQYLGIKTKEEIIKELDKNDLFVFITRTEGFSNSVLEAMSRGLPILTTDVGANYDMLENIGGICIDRIDDNNVLEKFSLVLDYNWRKNASEWNINKVKSEYSLSVVFELLNHLYDEVIFKSFNDN